MVTELQKKMGGWIVEMVAPALIMVMTGSLTFFLMQVAYHGDYPGRVSWVLGLFVFASVLISRISIMEGFDKATFYGLILGAATLFVLTTLSNLPLILGIGFIGIIWWFNSKLTWDCTVIDGSRDTTDRGLLSRFGFRSDSVPEKSEEEDEDDPEEEIEGTSSSEKHKSTAWTARFLGRKKVANTPGVWVLILSLAAFPIFGIGQGFIGEETRRQAAFFYFCTYLAAGLGLLVTTAMMGLQRYLMRRNATMPNAVALSWVGFGTLMIFAILVASWVLPRPYSEYSVAENPFKFDRKSEWGSSRNSFGSEGKDDGKSPGRTDPSKESSESGSGKGKGKKSSGQKKSNQSNQGKKNSGQKNANKSDNSGGGKSGKKGKSNDPSKKGSKQKGGGSEKSPKGSGKQQKDNSPNKSGESGNKNKSSEKSGESPGKSNEKSSPKNGKSDSDKSNQKQGDQGQEKSKDSQGGNQKSESQQPRNENSERNQTQGGSGSAKQRNQERSEKQSNSSSGKASQSNVQKQKSFQMPSFRGVLWILQWLFTIVIVIVAAFFIWKYREQIWQRYLAFLEELKQFWARLWSRKAKAGETEDDAPSESRLKPQRVRQFSEFRNPYLTGEFQDWPVETLVRYSFEALEAWGRERGIGRSEEQTPHEFVMELIDLDKNIARSAKKLADHYCAVAFAKDDLDGEIVNNELGQLWSQLNGQPVATPLQPA